MSCLGCSCQNEFEKLHVGVKALDLRVQSLETALLAQKAAYEAMKDVFEGLVNGVQSQKS